MLSVARWIAAFTLIVVLAPATASAQGSCSFVLGFASFRDQVGPAIVGDCVENQRTLTVEERIAISDRVTANISAGGTVQRTTNGLLVWSAVPNSTLFHETTGQWSVSPDGSVTFATWDELAARPPSIPTPEPAPSRQSSAPQAIDQVPPELRVAWDTLVASPGHYRDAHLGQTMERVVAMTGVALTVAPLPARVYGEFRASTNTLTISPSILSDDPRAVAAVLAHELMHAAQAAQGLSSQRACITSEVEAFVVQATLWYSYWRTPGRTFLPSPRTRLQAHLNEVTTIWNLEGEPGLYKMVVDAPDYQSQCQMWLP